MPLRTLVLVDYANARAKARQLFTTAGKGWQGPEGHFNPKALSETLCSRHNEQNPTYERLELAEVGVFCGIPARTGSKREMSNRISAWEALENVQVTSLENIFQSGQEQEKGVDVALAVRLATSAQAGEFDCAILFAEDRDYVPAVAYVRDETQTRIGVAFWKGGKGKLGSVVSKHADFRLTMRRPVYDLTRDDDFYGGAQRKQASRGRRRPRLSNR